MKAIVIYKSSTGFTKKYAEWIASALSCDAVSTKAGTTLDLNNYDAVIFGGWLFAGKLQGYKEYKEKLMSFKGKKAVFVIGSMPAENPQAATMLNACFSDGERKMMGTFYMQGGLDYANMGGVHKMMMKMMCFIMKKQHGVDSAEYKTISTSFDATDKANIEPLVLYITQK